jgi:hypothetical protein
VKRTRNAFICMLLAGAALTVGACQNNSAFVQSADLFVNKTVGPEYEAYVRNDANLSPEQKQDRLQNVSSFRDAVAAEIGPVTAR